jgi:hypothetical protein
MTEMTARRFLPRLQGAPPPFSARCEAGWRATSLGTPSLPDKMKPTKCAAPRPPSRSLPRLLLALAERAPRWQRQAARRRAAARARLIKPRPPPLVVWTIPLLLHPNANSPLEPPLLHPLMCLVSTAAVAASFPCLSRAHGDSSTHRLPTFSLQRSPPSSARRSSRGPARRCNRWEDAGNTLPPHGFPCFCRPHDELTGPAFFTGTARRSLPTSTW